MPGRFTEDVERLVFRLHQILIEELETDRIAALPTEERTKVVEEAAQAILRREVPSIGGITRD
ncbi:MAG: hypothetical protein ACE5KW_01790, partial [Dehalococcoidia bacterium]